MHFPLSNLHRNHCSLTTVFLSVVILVGSFFLVAAQASTTIQVTPPMLSIRYGEKAQISVEIMNAENMYGFELHISYDPATIQVVDGDPDVAGIQLLPGDMYETGQGFLVANDADNEAGNALFAFTLLAPSPPMAGDGTLVVVEVEAVGGASSTILMEKVILASPDGEALQFVANNGEVVVEGVPESTSAIPEESNEPSARETETRMTPAPPLPMDEGPQTSQFSQYVLLGAIFVLIVIMISALFLILRWGFKRR